MEELKTLFKNIQQFNNSACNGCHNCILDKSSCDALDTAEYKIYKILKKANQLNDN